MHISSSSTLVPYIWLLSYVSPFAIELFPPSLEPELWFFDFVTVTFLLLEKDFSLLRRPFLFKDTNTLALLPAAALRTICDPSKFLVLAVIGTIVLSDFATAYFSASKGSKL